MNRPAAAVSVLSCAVSLALSASAAGAEPSEPTKKECVSANESGQDLRRSGKFHEARTTLAVCLSQRCPHLIREDCAQRLTELEAAMPTLVFVAKDSGGRDVSDVRLSMDGQTLIEHLSGSAVAIDPGEHRFTFESSGLRPSDTTLVVREGDKDRRVIAVLAPLVEPPTESAPAQPALPPRPPPNSGFWHSPTTHNVALGIALVGIPVLAVGSVLGLVAKSNYDHAYNDECPVNLPDGKKLCSPQGYSDYTNARSQTTLADVAFIAGAAMVAVGATVYFLTPSKDVAVEASPTPQGATFAVRARF